MDKIESHELVVDKRQISTYLAIVAAMIGGFILLLMLWGLIRPHDFTRRDHFGQVDLNGDPSLYMNFQNLATKGMQDRDILFHGFGESINNLKKADIVFLGHSVLEFGIDQQQIAAFEKEHNVRIFNLSMPGVASGEFSRLLIKKWSIHPKIWIINADDYPENFFTPSMQDFFGTGSNSISAIANSSNLSAYKNVASRSVRYRLEKTAFAHLPVTLRDMMFPRSGAETGGDYAPTSYRSVVNGTFNLSQIPLWLQKNGPLIKLIRTQDCEATDEEVENAKRYVADIGGTTILTLMPYERWCPNRVAQIAQEVGLESFFPPDAKYNVLDGTHMTQEGAVRYTNYLLGALEQTYAFKKMIGDPNPGTPPAPVKGNRSLPFDMCLQNTTTQRMFTSIRLGGETTDSVMEPGQSLKITGRRGGTICTSQKPFNRNECPNERSQVSASCPKS